MGDPNLRFISSLRSSPVKSPAAGRRASLTVSSWHDPDSVKPKPVPSSVRRHSISTSLSPVRPRHDNASPSLLNFDQVPIAESKTDRRLVGKDQTASFWEPPVSCKRRLIRIPQGEYHSFFPIELTGRDYFHRVVALIARAFDLLQLQDLRQMQAHQPLRDVHPLLVEEFVHLLVANAPDYHLDEYSQKTALLLRQNDRTSTVLETVMQTILDLKSKLFSHISGWSSSKLVETKDLFRAAEQLLSLTFALVGASPSTAFAMPSMKLLQSEFKTLQSQMHMHIMFQTERMSALGWKWDNADSLEDPHLQPEEAWKQAFARYEELLVALEPYLAPPSKALMTMIGRVLTLEEELQQLSVQCADQSEYEEAQRLRDLAHAMENSVGPEQSFSLDGLNSLLLEAGALVTELDHFVVMKRQQRLFDQAKVTEDAVMHTHEIARELSQNVQTMQLLTSSALLERASREGTGFITSDFLFLSEQWPDQQSLASLLIRSASQDMLTVVEHWPMLTALKTSVYMQSLNQQVTVYDHVQGEWTSSQDMDPAHYTLGHDSHFDGPAHTFGAPFDSRNSDFIEAYQEETQSQSSTFSVQVLDALKAFDMLQSELNQLLTPPALAHSQLICRLIGVSNDLRGLTDISDHAHQPLAQGQNSLLQTHTGPAQFTKESDRLRVLIAAVEASIDADELTAEVDPQINASLCGRHRIDHIWQVIHRIKPGIRELMKLKALARNYRDYTAAAALETMQVSLESRIKAVEDSIVAFSMLDTDNDVHMYDGSIDVNERIAREGTGFLTSDYIFAYSCGAKGHSIGSLAIVAGAGAILRNIKQSWPHLTALGNNASATELTEPGNPMNSRRRSMMMSSGAQHSNFHDANSLRLMGFAPETLRIAGFSTVDILTAGYNAEQLKLAGFDAQAIHSAVGVGTDQMMFLHSSGASATGAGSGGHILEVYAQLMKELYDSTHGPAWKAQQHWGDLEYVLGIAANNYIKPGSGGEKVSLMAYQAKLKHVFQKLHGVQVDKSSFEVQKLVLPQNNLSGALPVSLGSVVTLQHVVLSANNLVGAIPASLGLLVNLQSLVLDRNKLQGEIPRTLKHLQQLTLLRLEHNQLEGTVPPVLGNLSRLKRLDLSHNRLSGPLPLRLGSSGQMQLQELLLNDNQLSGEIPGTWSQMTQLIHLDLHNNQLYGTLPAGIAQLQKLTGLSLQNNAGLSVNRQHLQKTLPKCRIKL